MVTFALQFQILKTQFDLTALLLAGDFGTLHPRYPTGTMKDGKNVGGKFMEKGDSGSGKMGITEAELPFNEPIAPSQKLSSRQYNIKPALMKKYQCWFVTQEAMEEVAQKTVYKQQLKKLQSSVAYYQKDSPLSSNNLILKQELQNETKKIEVITKSLDQISEYHQKQIKQFSISDPQPIIKAIEENPAISKALQEQGIDSKAAIAAAQRLAQPLPVSSAQEVFLRKADFFRFTDRLQEISEISQKIEAASDDSNLATVRDDRAVRVMAVKSEIKNGQKMDAFMASDRNPDAHEALLKSFSQGGKITSTPIADAVLKTLPGTAPLDVVYTPERDKGIKEGFQKVQDLYPSTVSFELGVSNDAPFALPTLALGGKPTPFVNPGTLLDPIQVGMHEPTHIYEVQSGLVTLSAAYIRARTISEVISPYQERNNAEDYPLRSELNSALVSGEVPYTDFSVPYTGLTYKDFFERPVATEVLTVGVEALSDPNATKSRIMHDRELLAYTLASFDPKIIPPRPDKKE